MLEWNSLSFSVFKFKLFCKSKIFLCLALLGTYLQCELSSFAVFRRISYHVGIKDEIK